MDRVFWKFGFILFFLLFGGIPFCMNAQTLEDARLCFRNGEYDDAIVFYDGLLAMYDEGGPMADYIKEERSKASQCQRLISQASSLIKSQYYTKAIENYEGVLKLNPSDPTARGKIEECKRLRSEYLAMKEQEEAWKNCTTLADYQAFIKKYPNSKHRAEADSLIPRLEREDDERRWSDACRKNTIFAYEDYLSMTHLSGHRDEAHARLTPLYMNRANEMFRKGNYEQAEQDYSKVIDQGGMTSEAWTKYHKAKEENLFKRISNPITRKYSDMLSFVQYYPNSQYISLVRGHLVEYDMQLGYFDDAREQVSKYQVALSNTSTPTKKMWLKIIKEREKEYNRRNKPSRLKAGNRPSTVRTGGNDSPLQIGIPVKVSSAFGGSFSSGISIGGWCAPFNVDFLVGYLANTEKTFFSVDPMFNIKRYLSDDPFSDYHICVGPSLAFSESFGASFGLRSGIGLHYSNLSVGVGYSDKTGLGFDIALTFTLAHYHIREH